MPLSPREFFPKMPDEVFGMWLSPFLAKIEWPFTSTSDDFGQTRWKFLLGNIPLSVWFSGEWKRVDVDINSAPIGPMSILMANEIISHCTTNAQTMTANLQDTKERFRTCTSFVRENKTIPAPLITMLRGGYLEILDGNHRLAALRYINSPEINWVPCWVFTPSENHG